MSRSLDDIDPRLRPLIFELISRLASRGVHVLIVDTLRTPAEQKINIAKGVSSTSNSRHLPQNPFGKSLAVDVVPYETFNLHGRDKLQWDPKDPAFKAIGEEAEALGLRWGGRWKKPHDPGHVELPIRNSGGYAIPK